MHNLNHIYFTHRRFDDDCLFTLLGSPLVPSVINAESSTGLVILSIVADVFLRIATD